MKTRCASVGPHPREVMMKHLKKVLLFRVGFAEKVSLMEKFFMPVLVCGEKYQNSET
jgi:hypothetical protein